MAIYTDQCGRQIDIPQTPKRIISIVPSQTELLFYLGLDTEVTGITKFCIYPREKFISKPKIGGTKQLNVQLIKDLQPDLIIANKEENERTQVEELMKFCPVWISDISNLTDALEMIESIGEVVGKAVEAKVLKDEIAARFEKVDNTAKKISVAYLIWRKPYMAAAKDTFINSLLELCGFTNAFDTSRYPEVDEDMLREANPDVMMLSSEPYPFGNKHAEELKALLPDARVVLVDGEMFSWYGSRLLLAPEYFKKLMKDIE